MLRPGPIEDLTTARRLIRRLAPLLAGLAGPVVLILAVIVFLLLKAFALRPQPNDDGVYFYNALRIAQGAIPYRDFFHAHPPLHVVPTAVLFKLFGYSFALGKGLVFGLAAVQGVCASLVVRRALAQACARWMQEAAALAATLLLLFSEAFLVASSDDTGLVQSSTALAVGLALLVHARPAAAGVLAGVAVMTSMQTGVLALFLVAAAWRFGGRGQGARAAVGAGAVVLTVHLGALALAGRAFVDQVYLFHLAKVARQGEGWRVLIALLSHDLALFAVAAAGAVALVLRGGPARRVAGWLALAVGLHLLFMATRPRVFHWYFVPALFPAAVLAGLGLAALLRAVLAPGPAASGSTRTDAALLLLAAALPVALVRVGPHGLDSPHGVRPYGAFDSYQWQDAPGLGKLNALVRSVFWRDHRGGPQRANPITESLWRQSVWLDSHPRMVEAVRAIARAAPGTSLFGDYATAPLVALDAGVPIAGDFVDTTGQRFSTGHARWADVRQVLADNPGALVLLRSGGPLGHRELKDLLDHEFEPIGTFESRSGTKHTLHRRKRALMAPRAGPVQ